MIKRKGSESPRVHALTTTPRARRWRGCGAASGRRRRQGRRAAEAVKPGWCRSILPSLSLPVALCVAFPSLREKPGGPLRPRPGGTAVTSRALQTRWAQPDSDCISESLAESIFPSHLQCLSFRVLATCRVYRNPIAFLQLPCGAGGADHPPLRQRGRGPP